MGTKDVKETWNQAASSWVEFVRSGKDIVRDEMSNPSMFELLGNIQGKKILDIACGEGYNSRIMAEMGASVVGVDISDELIRCAVEMEGKESQGIDYHVADASKLATFEDSSFDIVTCFMALMDIKDYCRAIVEVGRILKPKGRFVFNMPHPCFEIRVREGDGEFVGGWEFKGGADDGLCSESEKGGEGAVGKDHDTDKALYYKVDRYFDTNEEEIIPWKMERLAKPFTTIAYHRTLTEYSKALHDAGFLISRILEPKPTPNGMSRLPVLKGCLRIPHSIAIEAVKPE